MNKLKFDLFRWNNNDKIPNMIEEKWNCQSNSTCKMIERNRLKSCNSVYDHLTLSIESSIIIVYRAKIELNNKTMKNLSLFFLVVFSFSCCFHQMHCKPITK